MAIGTPGHRSDFLLAVPVKPAYFLPSGRVPNSHRAIRSGRCNPPAVGTPGCIDDAGVVPSQSKQIAMTKTLKIIPLPVSQVRASIGPGRQPLADPPDSA